MLHQVHNSIGIAAAAAIAFFTLIGLYTAFAQHGRYHKSERGAGYSEKFAKQMFKLCAGAMGWMETRKLCIEKIVPKGAHYEFLLEQHDVKCDPQGNRCMVYVVAFHWPPPKMIAVVFRSSAGTLQILEIFRISIGEIYFGMDIFKEKWVPNLGYVESDWGFKPKHHHNLKINPYFGHAIHLLWPALVPVLTNRSYDDYLLTFTGHSLGGSLASLAAFRTVLEGLRHSDDVFLYTFGAPRSGGYEYAGLHNHLVPNSYRVVSGADPVVSVPFCHCLPMEIFPYTPRFPCPVTGPAYHHMHEVWYPDAYDPKIPFIYCDREENLTCSVGRLLKLHNFFGTWKKHDLLLGQSITDYSLSGCDDVLVEEVKEVRYKALSLRFSDESKIGVTSFLNLRSADLTPDATSDATTTPPSRDSTTSATDSDDEVKTICSKISSVTDVVRDDLHSRLNAVREMHECMANVDCGKITIEVNGTEELAKTCLHGLTTPSVCVETTKLLELGILPNAVKEMEGDF